MAGLDIGAHVLLNVESARAHVENVLAITNTPF